MTCDFYTKAVLTVIALSLVWVCVNGATPTALAQAGTAEPVRVMLVDESGVPLVTQQGLRMSVGTEPFPVVVSNPMLAVELRSIARSGAWQPIQVEVLKQPPTLQPMP